MVLGVITKYGSLAVFLVLFALFTRRSIDVGIGRAGLEVGQGIGGFGAGIGTLGSGFSSLGQGIGTGISGLFQPVYDLSNFFNLDSVFGGNDRKDSSKNNTTGEPNGTTGGFNQSQSNAETKSDRKLWDSFGGFK